MRNRKQSSAAFGHPHISPLILRFTLAALLVVSAAWAASVSSSRWLDDVKYLSSDELRGRGDGMPELNTAADYIANEFRKAGLETVDQSYFRPFVAVTGVELGSENHMALLGPQARPYRLRQDFIPLSFSASGDVTAPVVFVGYGITAPEYSYDDYQGVDVRSKIALMLRHEPQEEDERSVFGGRRMTRYAEFVGKAITARQHGAVAVLVVNDPLNHSGDSLVPFSPSGGTSDVGIPVVQVKQDVVEAWLKETGRDLEDLQKAIDEDLSNHSFVLPASFRVNVHSDVRQQRSDLKNVAGLLRGNDPTLRDQIIVIGGHYDHLGIGGQGGSMAPAQRGQIHHGADDNASGTAGVMELARIFSAERDGLRRSILFMTFAGEELGLLGSADYVQKPLLPLDRTIAMINLDMIGRVQRNKLYVGGTGTSPGFHKLLEEENAASGFQIDFSDLGYDASDHMSFGRSQVPVLFFFSGLHSDYHKPSDTWDKVEPAETARVLELVARVVRRLDQADERPAYTPVTRQSRGAARASNDPGDSSNQSSGYGPYFGSVPDFAESERGVKFAEVRDGSPAAQAGLQAGDILVKFDGQEVRNLYDFTYALRAKQPGDEVPVVVLRADQEIQATVKLGRRE